MKQLFSVIVLIVLSAFAAGANLAAPLLTDLDVEYTYDRNGNMTSDANKGLEMSWDYNNRLYKVEDDEMTMTFNRTGSGQKLGKSVYVGPKLKDYLRPGVSRSNSLGGYPAFPRDSMLVYPTDSIFHIGNTTLTENFGSYEYVNGKFARLNTSTGYRDSEGTHVYVRDWQGNIRAVVRKGDDGSTVLEQATYYYPYGMPMAESTNPTANRYKYTGKELLTNKGFNCYDYGARFYDPATGIWLSADKKSRRLPSYSHYVFCNADPINYKDPDGKWSIKVSASEDRAAHPYATFNVLNNNGQIIYRTIVKVQGTHRNRSEIKGDTPCGLYNIKCWEETGDERHDITSYGPNHFLRLEFISGEGSDKRTGILVHGGRAQFPELWNTLGCIRIADEDIKELKAITDYLEQNDESEKPETLEVSNSQESPVTFQDREEYQILYHFELPELIVTPNNEVESNQTETT